MKKIVLNKPAGVMYLSDIDEKRPIFARTEDAGYVGMLNRDVRGNLSDPNINHVVWRVIYPDSRCSAEYPTIEACIEGLGKYGLEFYQEEG